MEDIEVFKNVFSWFLDLSFTFGGVDIKIVYLFILNFFILIISLFFSKKD